MAGNPPKSNRLLRRRGCISMQLILNLNSSIALNRACVNNVIAFSQAELRKFRFAMNKRPFSKSFPPMAVPNSIEQPVEIVGNLASETTAATPKFPKIIPFSELCRCGEEVWIENEGQVYRLRRTRQGKLILTK